MAVDEFLLNVQKQEQAFARHEKVVRSLGSATRWQLLVLPTLERTLP